MPDRAKLDALTEVANELVQEVNTLNQGGKQVENLTTKVLRNYKILWLCIASLVGLFVVTVILGITVYTSQNNSEKLDKLTQRLDYSQTVTRKQVLCPLYQVFLDSKSEQGRAAYPKGPAEYDRLFATLERSYKVLHCTPPNGGG